MGRGSARFLKTTAPTSGDRNILKIEVIGGEGCSNPEINSQILEMSRGATSSGALRDLEIGGGCTPREFAVQMGDAVSAVYSGFGVSLAGAAAR